MEQAAVDGEIGHRLRALRVGGGLTLDELAMRSGVSRAMLSRIERGESSPTAQLLNRVCAGLGATLSALFAVAEAPVSPFRRAAEQTVWRDPASGYRRRAVAPPGTGSPVQIAEVEFPPGASVTFETQHLSDADQHIWLLQGAMEIAVGDELHRLRAGDCLFMRFDAPISFANRSGRPARYAVIISVGNAR